MPTTALQRLAGRTLVLTLLFTVAVAAVVIYHGPMSPGTTIGCG